MASPIGLQRLPCNVEEMRQQFPKLHSIIQNLADEVANLQTGIPAITTAAWHKGGGTPYVLTNIGTVELPPSPSRDWNIPAGWPINVKKIPGGFRIIDDVLLDAKIGMEMGWCLASGDIPQGWAIQDGVANASPAGSGINKIGTYCKYGTTAGTQAGTDSYTPTGTVAEHTMTGNLFGDLIYGGSASTDTYFFSGTTTVYYTIDLSTLQSDEFTLTEHDAHNHDINPFVSNNVAYPGGGDLYYFYQDNVLGTGATEHQPQRAYFTESSSFSTSSDLDLSGWDHAHNIDMSQWNTTITIPYELVHDHNWTGDEMIIDLSHTTTIPIERIDNSSG
jgi:hypothetical protein